jgi:hypothetical protein
MAAASSHTHKYSNVSNQDSEVSQEPIYQNQAELRKQLQMLDKREPIYQNLPAHEKLMLLQEKKLQDQCAVHVIFEMFKLASDIEIVVKLWICNLRTGQFVS